MEILENYFIFVINKFYDVMFIREVYVILCCIWIYRLGRFLVVLR